MIENFLYKEIKLAIFKLYSNHSDSIQFQKTRKEFDGDITLVVFPILKISRKNPYDTAKEIGDFLIKKLDYIDDFNVVKGFLNIIISKDFWLNHFHRIYNNSNYGLIKVNSTSPLYVVEYSSPNTNKPIHLGHLRNNFIGHSVSKILIASGKNVKKVQIINDRGIHICKSMLAWKEYGNNETPSSSGIKGDHLVGKYYIKFNQIYQKEVDDLVSNGIKESTAKKDAPILKKAQNMLIKWEDKDPDVIELWKKMNSWVYTGFDLTYKRLGIDFDRNYYESDTYLFGKDIVKYGLKKGIFYKKDDSSIWIDLSEHGLDEKIIIRSDGTAVYMTQDIGTAVHRYNDFKFSNMIYTVANEQDYHFKVLFLILEKLGYKWAKNCFHLSYGMVNLPTGKMKSREGTVVDADDFLNEMFNSAKDLSNELGKLDGFNKKQKNDLYEMVSLGAVKYFMLKVDPKKEMLFNPDESIDFNGNTGPFIQYTYARIQSLKLKYNKAIIIDNSILITDYDKEIIKLILQFPALIQEAAKFYSPALLCNYTYDLVKLYNHYYQNVPILKVEDDKIVSFRVALSTKVGEIIKTSMDLLGIHVPNRM